MLDRAWREVSRDFQPVVSSRGVERVEAEDDESEGEGLSSPVVTTVPKLWVAPLSRLWYAISTMMPFKTGTTLSNSLLPSASDVSIRRRFNRRFPHSVATRERIRGSGF